MSFEAFQPNVRDEPVTLDAARPVGADGAVVSPDDNGEQALVAAVNCADGEELPAASRATTANVYEVPQERPLWPAFVVVTDVIFVPLR